MRQVLFWGIPSNGTTPALEYFQKWDNFCPGIRSKWNNFCLQILSQMGQLMFWRIFIQTGPLLFGVIVQELCESRGGRPGLSVLTSLLVSVDVKLY